MPHHPQSRRAWLFSPPTTPLTVETFFTRSAVHPHSPAHTLPAATSGTDGVPMADQSRRMGSWNLLHCEIHTLSSLSHPYHTQSVDVLVAVCLAGITRLHTKEQVRITMKTSYTHTLSLSLPQLRRQARERGSYGKGVSDILLKTDHSLPGFVATV